MKNITLTFDRKGFTIWSDGDDYYAFYVHKPTMSKWRIVWEFERTGKHIGSLQEWVKSEWDDPVEVFRWKEFEQGLTIEVDILESDETYESVSRALATPPPSLV